jgi:hypothetical protein
LNAPSLHIVPNVHIVPAQHREVGAQVCVNSDSVKCSEEPQTVQVNIEEFAFNISDPSCHYTGLFSQKSNSRARLVSKFAKSADISTQKILQYFIFGIKNAEFETDLYLLKQIKKLSSQKSYWLKYLVLQSNNSKKTPIFHPFSINNLLILNEFEISIKFCLLFISKLNFGKRKKFLHSYSHFFANVEATGARNGYKKKKTFFRTFLIINFCHHQRPRTTKL